MRRQQAMRTDAPAIRNAEEERLCPVPRSVQANGPPQRTGAPQAEREHQARAACAKKADGRLAGVEAVQKAEAEGDEHGRTPEADRLRAAACGRQITDEPREAFCE